MNELTALGLLAVTATLAGYAQKQTLLLKNADVLEQSREDLALTSVPPLVARYKPIRSEPE